MQHTIEPVRHGLMLALLAMICGALWAGYLATHHEQLHGGLETQELAQQQAEMQALMADLSMEEMNMDNPPAATEHEHAPGTPPHEHTAGHQHSHTGSLAGDAMQRLLRGHIHFMGLGLLAAVLLLVTAFTGLKPCYKRLLGWSFGIGALAYPPAWITMGFRTVGMGPEAAEASIMWLFAPAVALLIGSLIAVLGVLVAEQFGLNQKRILAWAFDEPK